LVLLDVTTYTIIEKLVGYPVAGSSSPKPLCKSAQKGAYFPGVIVIEEDPGNARTQVRGRCNPEPEVWVFFEKILLPTEPAVHQGLQRDLVEHIFVGYCPFENELVIAQVRLWESTFLC
jgi:hypothetical protein